MCQVYYSTKPPGTLDTRVRALMLFAFFPEGAGGRGVLLLPLLPLRTKITARTRTTTTTTTSASTGVLARHPAWHIHDCTRHTCAPPAEGPYVRTDASTAAV